MNKIGTQRIETERLILRPFTSADAEAMYHNWAADPEVTKYLTWQTHESPEATRALLTDWVRHYAEGDFFEWAIVLKDTQEPIGSIGVVGLDEAIAAAEVGYCLGRAYWGRGLMPEALRAVMDFLFDEVDAERVLARHDSENPKSGRALQKAGMRLEGTLRRGGRNNRGIIDVVLYAALSSDRG